MLTYKKILNAIGEASLMWTKKPAGRFKTEKALELARKLYKEANGREYGSCDITTTTTNEKRAEGNLTQQPALPGVSAFPLRSR